MTHNSSSLEKNAARFQFKNPFSRAPKLSKPNISKPSNAAPNGGLGGPAQRQSPNFKKLLLVTGASAPVVGNGIGYLVAPRYMNSFYGIGNSTESNKNSWEEYVKGIPEYDPYPTTGEYASDAQIFYNPTVDVMTDEGDNFYKNLSQLRDQELQLRRRDIEQANNIFSTDSQQVQRLGGGYNVQSPTQIKANRQVESRDPLTVALNIHDRQHPTQRYSYAERAMIRNYMAKHYPNYREFDFGDSNSWAKTPLEIIASEGVENLPGFLDTIPTSYKSNDMTPRQRIGYAAAYNGGTTLGTPNRSFWFD